MKNDEKLRDARIINKLPDISGRNENLPEGLVGATIIGIGAIEGSWPIDGGGFAIDYQPAGSSQVKRAILAFDETAMWSFAYFSDVGGTSGSSESKS